MIRNMPATRSWAAAACVAAAVFSLTATRHAAAQQTVDMFGGTFTNSGMLQLAGGTIGGQTTAASSNFGPGFAGTVALNLNVADTITESFLLPSGGSTSSYQISLSGAVAANATTDANKTYAGVSLTPGATYAFTLVTATTGIANLNSTFNIALSAGGTTYVNTANGQGLGGTGVNVLSLFGAGNRATFQFTVPTTATGTLGADFSSTEAANAAGLSYTFTSATITQVPEPGPAVASLLGAGALMVLGFRRRPR